MTIELVYGAGRLAARPQDKGGAEPLLIRTTIVANAASFLVPWVIYKTISTTRPKEQMPSI